MEKKLKDKKKGKEVNKETEENIKIDDGKRFHVEDKKIRRGLTVKEIRAERELLRENITLQFEKFRRRTGLKVTYCEYNIDESKDVFLAIEDI